MSAATRTWLAAITGLLAIVAFGGSAGLGTGVIDLGDSVTARLPFASIAFAAAALAVVVGLPMAAVTYLALRADSRTAVAAVLAGGLLLGWIALEIRFVQSYSWVQPVFAFAGLAVMLVGLRHFPVRSRQ